VREAIAFVRAIYPIEEQIRTMGETTRQSERRCGLATLTHAPSPMGLLGEILGRQTTRIGRSGC
jgi:hypothetical protein